MSAVARANVQEQKKEGAVPHKATVWTKKRKQIPEYKIDNYNVRGVTVFRILQVLASRWQTR
jgi:hypothetical protein